MSESTSVGEIQLNYSSPLNDYKAAWRVNCTVAQKAQTQTKKHNANKKAKRK